MQYPPIGAAALLVWFACGSPAEHVNRLRAEWLYALEVIEPELPGDLYGCRLARYERDLGAEPVEFEVTDTRVSRLEAAWFVRLFERVGK